MGKIVMSGPQNVSLDGVVQDPDGAEGFSLGGWFNQFGGKDLEEWAKVALDEAKANVLAAHALIDSQQGAVETQLALIDTAKGSVAVDQANEVFAQQETERYSHLATTGYGSVQNAQNASAKIASSHASIERDTGTLQSMKKQLDVIKAHLSPDPVPLPREVIDSPLGPVIARATQRCAVSRSIKACESNQRP